MLVVFKQVVDNSDYLHWKGFSKEAIMVFVGKFGLSAFLIVISLAGALGLFFTLKNLQQNLPNGDNVTVIDIQNRNGESVGYIATYIIPFLFQDFNSIYGVASFIFLMIIIYRIYIHSNMILINPVLSYKYAIYELSYKINEKEKTGLLISTDKQLQEDTTIKEYGLIARLPRNNPS